MNRVVSQLLAARDRVNARLATHPVLEGMLKYGGYSVFALFCFVTFLRWSLPMDRIRERVQDTLRQRGWQVTMSSLDLSLPLGAVAEDVNLAIPSKKPATKPARLLLDRVAVDAGVIASLRKRANVKAHVQAFDGEARVRYAEGGSETSAEVSIVEMDLSRVALVPSVLGIPVWGRVTGDGDLTMPGGKLAQSQGKVELAVEGLAAGDGKGKIKIPGNAFLEQGITIGRVLLGNLKGTVAIDKGTAKLRGVSAKSPDVELQVEGEVQLRDPVSASQLRLYVLFRPSQALLDRDAALKFATSSMTQAKRDDGFYGIQINGTLAFPQSLLSKTAQAGGAAGTTAATTPSKRGLAAPTLPSAPPPSPPPPSPSPPPAAEPPPTPSPPTPAAEPTPPPPVLPDPPPLPPPPPPVEAVPPVSGMQILGADAGAPPPPPAE